jgi:hypothetical protein
MPDCSTREDIVRIADDFNRERVLPGGERWREYAAQLARDS